MTRQSGIEYKARIGMKADPLSFGVGSANGGGRGGLGGSYGPAGDGGSGQGGPEGKSSSSGGSSIGFIAAYALVLGLSGYVVMTDDSATAGSFSLFSPSEVEDDSFRVKPLPSKDRSASFDWTRRGGGELRRWESEGLDVGQIFASADTSNVFGQSAVSGGSTFLIPGQLDAILDGASSASSYSRYSGTGRNERLVAKPSESSQAAGGAFAAPSVATGRSEYKRYTFETPKLAGVVPINAQSASAAQADQNNASRFSVFKGRVRQTGGFDGYDWRLSLEFSADGVTATAKLNLEGSFDASTLGRIGKLKWSSDTSTYFYQLEPGLRQNLSKRGRELLEALIRENDQGQSEEFSLTGLRTALTQAVRRKAMVYVVRDSAQTASRSALRAVLIQDLKNRTWQVYKLKDPRQNGMAVNVELNQTG